MASPLLLFCFLITFALTIGDESDGNSQKATGQPEMQFQGPSSSDAWDKAHQAMYGGNGDIIHPEGPNNAPSRSGTKPESRRWPGYPGGGTVPYEITSGLSKQTQLIQAAMKHISDKVPCIKFKKRNRERDYLSFINRPGSCASYVGKAGGKQTLELGDGCFYIGTVIHELIHALGGFHEHQRSDRDDYVIIRRQNIRQGAEANFEKVPSSQELSFAKFDDSSIMIYGNTAFSVDGRKHTMDAKNGKALREPYDKKGMTAADEKLLKGLYKCK